MSSHSDASPPEMGAEPEPFSPEDESRPGLLQRLFGRSQVEPDEASALAAATLAQTQEMQGKVLEQKVSEFIARIEIGHITHNKDMTKSIGLAFILDMEIRSITKMIRL